MSRTLATTLPCLGSDCHALVMEGRGYCTKCGGPSRLRKEREEAGRENRAADAADKAVRHTARPAHQPAARKVAFLPPGDGRGVVAPGQGLSRFKRAVA